MTNRPPFLFAVTGIGALLTLCYAITAFELVHYGRVGKSFGYWVQLEGDTQVVVQVAPEHPAAQVLQRGDRIIAINGHGGMPAWLMNRRLLLTPAGSTDELTIVRKGQITRVRAPVQVERVPLWWGVPLHAFASLACFTVALVIGLLKPTDRTVQWGSLTFFGLAAVHLLRPLGSVYWSAGGSAHIAYALLVAFDPLHIATGYLFASRFPRAVQDRRWWRFIPLLISSLVAMEWLRRAPSTIFSALDVNSGEEFYRRWGRVMVFLNGLTPPLLWKSVVVAIVVAIWAVVARNYRSLTEPDLRRRIRWVVFGLVVALFPMALLQSAATLRTFSRFGIQAGSNEYQTLEQITEANVGIVLPLCLAYAVLRHRLLDIQVAVRTGIRYLMAKRVMEAVLFLPVVLIVMRGVLEPGLTVRQLIFGSSIYFGLMVAGAIGIAYRQRLLTLVDRRFFQEAYNQEAILRRLLEEIKAHDSISDIARFVSEQLEAALHPTHVLLFCRQGPRGEFTLAHPPPSGWDVRLDPGSPLLRVLEGEHVPQDLPRDFGSGDVAQEWTRWDRLGIRLIAAITASDDRMNGVLMLGERRSEQPYTATDRNLIQAIAAQIGMVYENVSLREEAKRQVAIRRNVFAHIEGTDFNLLKECPVCGRCYDRPVEQCPSDGTTLALTLAVERVIDGVYRLERRIGSGGMGAVFRATDLRLGRSVAVKVMMGSLFGNDAALRRFEREARAAARLSHPNIVSLYDFGTIGADGAYLVMELIDGITFRAELRGAGTLTPTVLSRRVEHLLDGLIAAHHAGVVHRDLKPENLINAQLGSGTELLKILDFGLAKLTPSQTESDSFSELTAAGAVLGTLGYMAPEQLLGEEVDERTDVFPVGVMVVEALTGKRPFSGTAFPDFVRNTLTSRFSLGDGTPELRRLDTLLQRMLARRKEDRPTVAALKPELLDGLRGAVFPNRVAAAGPTDETRSFQVRSDSDWTG